MSKPLPGKDGQKNPDGSELTTDPDTKGSKQYGLLSAAALRLTSAALTLGTQIAYVRWFGAEDFGLQIQVLNLAALVVSLGSWGADRVVVRELSPVFGSPDWRMRLRALARFQAALGAFGLLALALVLAVEPRPGWGLALWAASAMLTSTFCAAVVRAAHRHAWVDVLELLVRPLLAMLASLAWQQSALASPDASVAMGTVTAHACVALSYLALMQRLNRGAIDREPVCTETGQLVPKAVWPSRQKATRWQSRWPYAAMGAAGYAHYQFDLLVLATTLPSEELAAYGMAAALTKAVSFLPAIAQVQALPLLAVQLADPTRRKEGYQRQMALQRRSTALALGGWLLLVAIGYPLLQQIDPRFVVAYPALLLLALAQVAQAAFTVQANRLALEHGEHKVLRAQALGAALAVCGILLLTPPMGMTGAAVAVAMAAAVNLVALRWDSRVQHA